MSVRIAIESLAAKGLVGGDWDRALKMFGGRMGAALFAKKMKAVALKRMAAYLSGQVKRNIRSSGRVAGRPFVPLQGSTIRRKGSSKPLIDTGDLMGSVHPHFIDENAAFVGVKRGTIGKKTSGHMVDIAEIHEFGVVSQRVSIPPRPFLGPVRDHFGEKAGDIYGEWIQKALDEGEATAHKPTGDMPAPMPV